MMISDESKRKITTESTPLLESSSTSLVSLIKVKDKTYTSLSKTYPEEYASYLDSIFFSWITPLLELGNRRPLESSDLFQLNPSNRSYNVYDKFMSSWNAEIKFSKESPRIYMALMMAFGRPFLIAGMLKLMHDSLLFVSPMVIQGVIGFLNDPNASIRHEGIYYALVMFISGILQSFCLRQYFYFCFLTGMRLRAATITAIYNKSLKLSSSARQRSSAGEISNLMSVDATRLQDLTPYLHGIWYGLFQMTVSIVLLWQQMGPSCLAGVAVICCAIPATAFIARIMRRLQSKLLQVKDERMKICYEVLSGMKVIKLQAWEKSYRDKVMSFRDKELSQLKTYVNTRAASATLFNTLPSLVAIVVFMAYVLSGHELDVSTALTSLSLFNILRFPLFMLPQVINNVVEAMVSFKRIQKFLLEEEVVCVSEGDLTDVGIDVSGADFTWDAVEEGSNASPKLALTDVHLKLAKGQLCAIVGHVGCGKSTLLASVLGDAKCIKGHVYRKGSVAYVSQQSFIQNATLKDNILFGLPYDEKKYQEAIKVSALAQDLKVLPGGDATEIGEKGINLSGGQRTRVSIARAVYQDADIYLLDDPLAAVDGHVGRQIFDECIMSKLRGKLRVLVTNAVTYLPQCDHVLVIENGKINQSGSYSDLIKDKDGILHSLVRSTSSGALDELGDAEEEEFEKINVEDAIEGKEAEAAEKEGKVGKNMKRSSSVTDKNLAAKAKDSQKLISAEDRSTGDVPWSVYKYWFASGFGVLLPLALANYLMNKGFDLSSTFWLSLWSEHATADTQMFYLYIYIALQLCYFFGTYVQKIFNYFCALRASRKLFHDCFDRIVRAPMSFFDTTPLGRIVNRLSKDVTVLDESIPVTFDSLMACIIGTTATLVTVSYVTPMFISFLIPICIGYYMSQRYFIKTSRELQRLDSISRSPVYALLTETLDGLTTIRAFAVERTFANQNNFLLDQNQRAYFLNFSINCWLALRLEFAGTLIASGATLFAVLQHGSSNALFAGLAGVSMSYAFSVTQTLNWSVRMASQMQTQMVSIERIQTYTEMGVEAELFSAKKEVAPKPEWPQNGQIEFQMVNLRYRQGLPLVLKDLSFTIRPREKIGIVGRTGAGKSSIIVSLMRLVEIEQGAMLIDNVNITNIGLHELRARISVIPQDPVLFSGTVRANLDPFRSFTDTEVWTSIERAHLSKKITSLEQIVAESGSNFSVGERQLLCIARALLRKSRIILLDEATASIDVKTDALIQESIKTEFADCTCLTIAHRINTVMDSDRVLVMDRGGVAEFDTVENLLKIENGIFASLVDEFKTSNKAGLSLD